MKKIVRLLFPIFVFLLFAAPSIYFDVMVPAVVDLPSHIRSLAVIDRSQSDNKVVNVLEKGIIPAITGERDPLSLTCINGLYDELSKQDNITLVRTSIMEKRPGTGLEFPLPMDWKEVETHCKNTRTDALLSLEIFHMNLLQNVAEVKVGFRIYDPESRQIIDEFAYFNSAGLRTPGPNMEEVVRKLANQDQAMYNASYRAGVNYAQRITPSWYRAERKYYKRSKKDPYMAEGARMMEVNDWDAAISALNKAMESKHMKTRGRAAHNLAVVYEILGDTDQALNWAQAAWGKYGNKASRDYVRILQQRQHEIDTIRKQQDS